MNIRRTKPTLRIQFLGLCMLLGLSLLLFRLWWVQVARGYEWTARIQSSSEATVRIPSIRGEIRDRNGVPLVQNRASYAVDFYLPEMVKGYRQRYGRPPETQYRATISGMPKDMKEPDIVRIVNDGVVPRLEDLDLARNYNANQLQRHYRNNTEVPYSYIKDIDFATMAKFSEHDVGLPGVDIAIKPVRSYVYGALASHILGYVGAPDDTNTEEARKYTFYQGDVVGKSNVEKTMDQYLRGQPGIRVMRRNAKGTIDGVVREEPPKQGANVCLTIDARIQAIAEEALRAVGRGAAVVVDPNNGNVLAMASVPSFDPNTFIPSIKAKDWKTLRADAAHPLVNRAISAFPPGSTFKLITALAGMRKGIGKQKFTCTGGVSYGDHYFQCWINEHGGAHGTLGVSEAIKVSCNAFFYQYGNAAGIDAIDTTGDALGLGKPTGVEITGESPGVLPGPDWMRITHPNERWSSAYTANVSIGQGYDLATPLQMAMAYSAIANGGISYYPRLVDRVLNQDGSPLLDAEGKIAVPQTPKLHADFRDELTPDQIETVRRGFWRVVNEDGGTGRAARMENVEVAGKTGTAQAMLNGKKDNVAWFCCFAPYDHPKYTVVVMVQGAFGHGGSVAAPIADRILERVIGMDEGKYEPQLAWLAPAHKDNPFDQIVAVKYKDDPLAKPGSDEEDASGNPAQAAEMANPGDAPDVEPEADARGRVQNAPRAMPVLRAKPVAPPEQQRPRNFFERMFNRHPRPAPAPAPAPTPKQRKRGAPSF
ncbi:MAG TPA: penicillin-binding protein 2 [Chthoniobacterales bacterium]|nr:penicillin-binding protein 2 [Chthoniobacterales bacterium]